MLPASSNYIRAMQIGNGGCNSQRGNGLIKVTVAGLFEDEWFSEMGYLEKVREKQQSCDSNCECLPVFDAAGFKNQGSFQ